MAAVASQASKRSQSNSRKRKRSSRFQGAGNSPEARQIALRQPQKRRRAIESIVGDSIKHMEPSLLVDHVAKNIKRFCPELSTVELEDKYLSQKIFYNPTTFDLPRQLDNLPSFLEILRDHKQSLSTGSENTGSPHTLVIAASGLRAADVARSLRKFQSKDCAVAKLFAKHIKLSEAIDYVKRTKIGIGIGTPQRLLDLLESNVLRTSNLKQIVVDGSHLDQKKRSIFDMKELLLPLVELLSKPAIKDRLDVDENAVKVLVF